MDKKATKSTTATTTKGKVATSKKQPVESIVAKPTASVKKVATTTENKQQQPVANKTNGAEKKNNNKKVETVVAQPTAVPVKKVVESNTAAADASGKSLGKRKDTQSKPKAVIQEEKEDKENTFNFTKEIEEEEEEDQVAPEQESGDEDDLADFDSDAEDDDEDKELDDEYKKLLEFKKALANVEDGDDEDDDDEDSDDDSEEGLMSLESDDLESDEEDDIESDGVSTTTNGTATSKTDASSEDEYNDDPNQFYETDDSEEDESVVNRVGNIPMHWYDDEDHIGYDVNGNKIMKGEKRDALDKFLDQADPKFWRTVYDKVNDKKVELTDEDLELIKSIRQRRFPGGYNPYEDWYDPGPNPDSIHPLSNAPTPKRSFLPHKADELREVRRLAIAIRAGWIKLDDTKEEKESKANYDLWAPKSEAERQEDELLERTEKRISRIPAPKQKLPGHVESFNPPEEYLLTQNELKAWHLMDPSRRPHNFVPQKYEHMRRIPTYNNIIKERFERCLDLYLCPRKQRLKKLDKDGTHLLPKLPKPQDLRPFPSYEELQYKGHTSRVRSISVSPSGQWLASGSDDGTIKIWEVSTTRCVQTYNVEHTVFCVQWNPNKNLNILAASYDTKIIIITPKLYGEEPNPELESIFAKSSNDGQSGATKWYLLNKENGIRIEIENEFKVKTINWHHKGEYFSTVASEDQAKAVKIHHLSKRKTQAPFKKSKSAYQVSKFHPSKPIFFLADQNVIRVYDLMKQKLIKKVMTGSRYISSIDVHPSGDHLILGGYDKRVSWFDLDMSQPYKVMRYHKEAVRRVVYHPSLPLFASCSDDLSIHVFHGMTYDDYIQNALIVPLKILRRHRSDDGLGVLDIVFHPTQPWIFSAGADSTIRLFN
ncbi:WD40 repeat-containing protein [Heterostelium album PN500]|uniref:Ribosome biogenesis protein BOP1 homolog n=1 Tax=Heterostelium pallidum (strain ATCC 26659 / Pp 5 / PN500) TaxID=670386 RepID=D3BN75_HETP5|nr:WD40 repeat-containing protein [Heterostelium album PN500]EFA76735.1 WD40 repeat-containing protein [Heterostelium album PN500]|eukprot:XP_020428867.1 WD40 repeat-containing protein [Heterostelium album PN500]